jgi:hypothetical protein
LLDAKKVGAEKREKLGGKKERQLNGFQLSFSHRSAHLPSSKKEKTNVQAIFFFFA